MSRPFEPGSVVCLIQNTFVLPVAAGSRVSPRGVATSSALAASCAEGIVLGPGDVCLVIESCTPRSLVHAGEASVEETYLVLHPTLGPIELYARMLRRLDEPDDPYQLEVQRLLQQRREHLGQKGQ